MTNAPVIKLLLHNAKYPMIVPACTKLEEMKKLAKAFHNDGTGLGYVFPDETLKQATSEIKNGLSTVALTYALFMILNELPKVINNVARAEQADALLTEVSKNVTLPKSLLDRLAALKAPRVDPQDSVSATASAAAAPASATASAAAAPTAP